MAKNHVKMAPVFRFLATKINSAKADTRFYITEPELGKRVVLKGIGGGVVVHACHQAVVDALLQHLTENDYGNEYDLTPAQAVQCVNYWLSITDPIPEPKYLGEKDDPALCFQRLKFNYSDAPGDTLILDDFMRRCSNAEAIKAFIGSLTVEDSPRFQYVWIYGSGGEGKGSFARGLVDIFGPGVVTMPVPKTASQKQFLAYSLQGKRLCVFPECSNFEFPQDPLFKQLTGGDHVWVEQKGEQGRSASINSKFLFLSNSRPKIEGTDADLRRIIYSEIEKPNVKYSPGTYDALIRAEMPNFIIKCRMLYMEKYPTNESIKIDDTQTKELIDTNEEQWEVLTEIWVERGAEFEITPREMREVKDHAKMNNSEYRKWVEYLREKLGIKSAVLKDKQSQKSVRKWIGIRKRQINESYATCVTDELFLRTQ